MPCYDAGDNDLWMRLLPVHNAQLAYESELQNHPLPEQQCILQQHAEGLAALAPCMSAAQPFLRDLYTWLVQHHNQQYMQHCRAFQTALAHGYTVMQAN